jgi:hypothetical protein
MTQLTAAGEPFRIADGESVVTAQKLFTRMGERLDLVAESLGTSVRLDAIMLETVSWQDPDELAARAAEIDRSDAVAPALEESEREEPLTISSEFAQATLQTVTDGDEERLEIEAPKLGYSVRLGARELEWVASQDPDTFSDWLETPFGPGGDEHSHGH